MSDLKLTADKPPRILLPVQLAEQGYVGELRGYYVRNTNCYNVPPFDAAAQIDPGRVYPIGFVLPLNPFDYLAEELRPQVRSLDTEAAAPEEIVRRLRASLGDMKPAVGRPVLDPARREKAAAEFVARIAEPLAAAVASGEYAFATDAARDAAARRGGSAADAFVQEALRWLAGVLFGRLYAPGTGDDRDSFVMGYREGERLRFVQLETCREVQQEQYSLKQDLFSRNTGILESDIMLKKGAVFIGCGSVGSLFALELAKAGVGRFLLIDNDTLGYHNLCRHQCGIYDVGRYKTDAMRDRILQVNPYARVVTQNKIVQDVPVDELLAFCDRDTIVIGGADNREGDLYASDFALRVGMPFMSIGCWERAFAGEIFYCLPAGMPTYADFVEVTGAMSGRVNQNRRFYTTEEDLAKATFEPGISADIDFVTVIAVKLALDLLNRDEAGYTQRLLPHLTQYTLVCNTNDPRIGGVQAEIFSYPLQVTTSIVVPYSKK